MIEGPNSATSVSVNSFGDIDHREPGMLACSSALETTCSIDSLGSTSMDTTITSGSPSDKISSSKTCWERQTLHQTANE
ncbi:MAG: hypothetical protein JXE06_09750 [Coriobacteriia bacterium]|nr:hypothetical protein [Coriobacteriia bacterium]MBN2821725.1 hypothetical protein [Coriobacteriia bacterium]